MRDKRKSKKKTQKPKTKWRRTTKTRANIFSVGSVSGFREKFYKQIYMRVEIKYATAADVINYDFYQRKWK